jgi:hypothetical protein
MNSNEDFIYGKVVKLADVHIEDIKIERPDKGMLELLRAANLDSLNDLTGENWEAANRELIKEYWQAS